MKKRNKLEVERDILELLDKYKNGLYKTQILSKANISTAVINAYLNMLLSNCYIDTIIKEDKTLIKLSIDGYNRLLELRKFIK